MTATLPILHSPTLVSDSFFSAATTRFSTKTECLFGLLFGLLIASSAQAATRQVGPGKTYAKPCQAIAAAAAGDIIEIDAAGSYAGDTCGWSTDNLIVRGVNGRAKIDITGVSPAQKKGIFAISANNATVENLELSGAVISVADGNNGAGIRHQGLNLTVRGCYFHDNQNGILGAPSTGGMGQVLIENSQFEYNGAGDGFSHNMYIGNYARFTLQYSYSHRGRVGHLVKTRALENRILYNRITDESNGTASYEIDIPDAGLSLVIGNLIEQSNSTQNPTMLSYAAESQGGGRDTHLYVINNTFLNNRRSGTFVTNASATPGVLRNNIFWNGGTVSSQASAEQTKNFVSTTAGDPLFANVASYDVRLLTGSPCIDAGSPPGSAGAQSLSPLAHYVHLAQSESRSVVGSAIDIGAYEFGNIATPDGGSGGNSDGGSGDDGATGSGSVPGGCACQIGSATLPSAPYVFALVGLLGSLALRQRRGSRRAAQ